MQMNDEEELAAWTVSTLCSYVCVCWPQPCCVQVPRPHAFYNREIFEMHIIPPLIEAELKKLAERGSSRPEAHPAPSPTATRHGHPAGLFLTPLYPQWVLLAHSSRGQHAEQCTVNGVYGDRWRAQDPVWCRSLNLTRCDDGDAADEANWRETLWDTPRSQSGSGSNQVTICPPKSDVRATMSDLWCQRNQSASCSWPVDPVLMGRGDSIPSEASECLWFYVMKAVWTPCCFSVTHRFTS